MTFEEDSSSGSLESQEESLRALIKDRPKNGRAMAMLACNLNDQAKLCAEPRAGVLRNEGLKWAYRSVETAPVKPFGYLSLSVLEPDHSKRLQALRKAIEYKACDDDSSYIKLGLLIRLLIDCRYEESLQVKGIIARGSQSHPSKRWLDESEQKLYSRISKALDEFWERISESDYCRQNMAANEYRLGLFFRKRQPVEESKIRAQKHLQRALQFLPPDHESTAVAKFWLGTLRTPTTTCAVDRCPVSYIVGLYSTFAENFDDLLVGKLSYQTPTLLRKLVDEVAPNASFQHGLDLGCGTGLSGWAFRNKVQILHGVDLSPEMMDKARDRKCYDSLQVGDVTNMS